MTLPSRFQARHHIVGTPAHWSLKTAQLGATLPLATAATGVGTLALFKIEDLADLALSLAILGAIGATCGAAVGATVGAFAPAFLERVRGRVSLWLLTPAQSAIGALGGALTGALTIFGGSWLFGGPVSPEGLEILTTLGAGVGAVAAPLWWLPFTVATVTGQRWPVTTVVGSIAPLVLVMLRVLIGS